MWQQIALGSALVLLTTGAHAFGSVVAMFGLTHVHRVDHTHIGRGFVISLLVLVISLVDSVVWAYAYVAVGAIPEIEPALYFSMVTFTTLGYGDLTLAPGWRLLASFEAANGIIIFGWTTALVVAYIQRLAPNARSHRD